MHVKGRCFPNRVRRLDMATTTQHDGALFSNTTICIAGRLCITHGESAGPAGPAASPDFQLFFACWFPPRHGKLLCPGPSEPMRWILTRRRRLPLALTVVLACVPPSAMPSRLLMTVAVKGPPVILRGFALITTQSQQMSRTWDPLNRRG